MVKPEVRGIGFDDAPFQRGQPEVPVVGVAMRGGSYVEAVVRTTVAQDGEDATQRIGQAVQEYRGRIRLGAVLLQNVMVAGFNVIDLDQLHARLALPVVAVARGPMDVDAVRGALLGGRIPAGAAKWERIERVLPRRAMRDGVAIIPAGIGEAEAWDLVQACTLRGHLPECLRLAHLTGAGWVLGQSRGS